MRTVRRAYVDSCLFIYWVERAAPQTWLPINDAVFARALDCRTRFGLKTPDALHLASAQQYDCDEFWTNDDRLILAAGPMAVNVLA